MGEREREVETERKREGETTKIERNIGGWKRRKRTKSLEDGVCTFNVKMPSKNGAIFLLSEIPIRALEEKKKWVNSLSCLQIL